MTERKKRQDWMGARRQVPTRMAPSTAEMCAQAAKRSGMALNQWICAVCERMARAELGK